MIGASHIVGTCRSTSWKEKKTMPQLRYIVPIALLATFCLALRAEEKKHSSGRPLPEMPEIKKPALFNTPEADKILAAMQVFPPDSPWNEDVTKLPVHANSKKIIAKIGA